MERTPVRVERPDCFSNYLKVEKCGSCYFKKKCVAYYKAFKQMTTITELTQKKQQTVVSAYDLLCWFVTKLEKRRYKNAKGLLYSQKYQDTMESIIASCSDVQLDPMVYLTAQLETIGVWAIQKGNPIYANMLIGKNAQLRFEQWTKRNHRRYKDHHRSRLTALEEDLIAAETLFVNTYLPDDSLRASDLEKRIQKVFPKWSLRKTRKRRHVRYEALRAWLASQSMFLPNRICIQATEWKWCDVRKQLSALLT